MKSIGAHAPWRCKFGDIAPKLNQTGTVCYVISYLEELASLLNILTMI